MFEVDGKNNVKVQPEYLLIPEFDAIWKADTSSAKKQAAIEFGYVYFVVDPRSPYRRQYSGDEVSRQVKIQILRKPSYRPNKRVFDAMRKYKELMASKEYKLFETTELLIDRMLQDLNKTLKSDNDISPTEMIKLIGLIKDIPNAANEFRVAKKAIIEDLDGSSNGGKSKLISRWEKPISDDEFDFEGVL